MADQRDAFLREVDEELRKDQLLQFMQKHGTWLAAFAVLLLLSVMGWQYWKHRQVTLAEAAGARYEAAARELGDKPSEVALKAFSALATDAPRGYRVLARLRIAAEHQKAGRPGEALIEYEALAAERSADQMLRDFAALQAAMLRMDGADWTEMSNRLTPLATGTSAWKAAAREGLAIAALKAGKADVARKELEGLLGERTATPGMLERVQLLLSVLTDQEASKAPSATPAQSKGGAVDGKAPDGKAPDGKAPDGKAAAPATTTPKK